MNLGRKRFETKASVIHTHKSYIPHKNSSIQIRLSSHQAIQNILKVQMKLDLITCEKPGQPIGNKQLRRKKMHQSQLLSNMLHHSLFQGDKQYRKPKVQYGSIYNSTIQEVAKLKASFLSTLSYWKWDARRWCRWSFHQKGHTEERSNCLNISPFWTVQDVIGI